MQAQAVNPAATCVAGACNRHGCWRRLWVKWFWIGPGKGMTEASCWDLLLHGLMDDRRCCFACCNFIIAASIQLVKRQALLLPSVCNCRVEGDVLGLGLRWLRLQFEHDSFGPPSLRPVCLAVPMAVSRASHRSAGGSLADGSVGFRTVSASDCDSGIAVEGRQWNFLQRGGWCATLLVDMHDFDWIYLCRSGLAV